MDAIRAFIAIELPEQIRQQLSSIEQQLQAKAGDSSRRAVRWVPTGNMHLTLKFLGEVSASNVQALARMLQRQAAQHSVFELTIAGLGAFPNQRRPRVIWIGAEAPAEFSSLQQTIEAETRALGYPAEDRPFSPHLTLGRVSRNATPRDIQRIGEALEKTAVGHLGTVRVENVNLYRSDLRPGGAVYTNLFSAPIGS